MSKTLSTPVSEIKAKIGDFIINLGDFVKNWHADVLQLKTEIVVPEDMRSATGVVAARIRIGFDRSELESWLDYVAKALGAASFVVLEVSDILGIYDCIVVFKA